MKNTVRGFNPLLDGAEEQVVAREVAIKGETAPHAGGEEKMVIGGDDLPASVSDQRRERAEKVVTEHAASLKAAKHVLQGENRDRNFVAVGQILRPHGVRGDVVVLVFCQDPEMFWQYGELWMGDRPIDLTKKRRLSVDRFVAHLEACGTRDAAERVCGQEVLLRRELLPPRSPDEFYIADLEGLLVEDAETGECLGRVASVQDFGAGAVVEVVALNSYHHPVGMFPFHRDAIASIHLDAGKMVLNKGWLV